MKRRDFITVASEIGGFTLTSLLLRACKQVEPVILTPVATRTPAQLVPQPTNTAVPVPPTPPLPTATETIYETEQATVQPTFTATPFPTATQIPRSSVVLVKTTDRVNGIDQALSLLDFKPETGKRWFIKPNFNSADAFPGSTHNDTLRALVQTLQLNGAARVVVGDRSGMGDTRAVMEQKGIFRMAKELDFETVVFDELGADDWVMMPVKGGHWAKGFAIARPALEADGIIQTCCLKTHRYGGDFTLSLKNSVGLAAKWIPGESYNYMTELHNSPDQRRMIAEINLAYQPDLILLDGIQAFVDGGPDKGTLVDSQVILAGYDRIAIDAVGVAILRLFGTTPAVSNGPIFQQDQIARAVELELGIKGPEEIQLITGDPESAAYAQSINQILLNS